MVGYDTHSEKLTKNDFAIAGAFSGFATRALCQPLDVLKIRFQLQVEKIAHEQGAKYKSLPHAFRLIIREEGKSALWKGHVPAQFLSVVYGTSQFWFYETLTEAANNLDVLKSHRNVINFACGSISGGAATILSFPFDVARTRLVAQGEQHKIYFGCFDCLRKIVVNEGFFVLFRGLLPTFIQVAPHSGMQMMSYAFFDRILKRFFGLSNRDYSFYSSIISGSLAGLVAKTAIYPLDLTRKRLQIQGAEIIRQSFGKTFTCRGMMHCMIMIYRHEGPLGFYKGLSPSLLKAVVATALHFSTYELMCEILREFKS